MGFFLQPIKNEHINAANKNNLMKFSYFILRKYISLAIKQLTALNLFWFQIANKKVITFIIVY